jgi:imidazolonepropionase-like amidohydrolase
MAGFSLVEPREGHAVLAEDVLAKAREINERQMEGLEKAHRAGVKIAFGTDAAIFPHGGNLRELELMTRAGMSPMETLVAATRTAAECLGWDDRIGTLEPGKLADLVISRVNPLQEVAALRDPDAIVLVMQGGEIVKDSRERS